MFKLRPIAIEHARGLHEAIDVVSRERIYFAQTEAPSLEWIRDHVYANIKGKHAQFVALSKAAVIGWCDILPHGIPEFSHTGVLGIGVMKEWRRRGVGQALIESTILKAINNGITRIELEVYACNTAAIALYRRLGFVEEGRKRKARCLDGKYEDVLIMALLIGLA